MLSVNQTIQSSRELLVVVVPVGAISRDKFTRYLGYVRHQAQIDLRENAGYFGKNKFLNRNWEHDTVCFNFESWENVHKSDWEELQLHRKLVGVIGLADCGAEERLELTYQAFQKAAAPYLEWIEPVGTPSSAGRASSEVSRRASPAAATTVAANATTTPKAPRTCLGFEPRADQTEIESTEFKMIPNQDEEHINFYVKHLLLIDLVAPILARLNSQYEAMAEILDKADSALSGNSASIPNPTTPMDADTTGDEKMGLGLSSKKRRRRAARLRKQYADLALLAGSPLDALPLYTAALEACKSVSDWEWAAAATEGYVAAKTLSLENTLSEDVQKELVEKLTEALGYYRNKKADMLEIELSLKLARFYVELGRKIDASELLNSTYSAAAAMSTQEKIRLTSAIALIFQSAGMQRKFAFYMREMAAQCASILPFAKSHQLVSKLAELYHVDAGKHYDPSHIHPSNLQPTPAVSPATSPPLEGSSLSSSGSSTASTPSFPSKSRRQAVLDTGIRWSKLRAATLSALIQLSSQTGDILQTIKYLVYMLRDVVPDEIKMHHEPTTATSGLDSSLYPTNNSTTDSSSSSAISPNILTNPSPASSTLVAASNLDLDWVQMLRDLTGRVPPVFLHVVSNDYRVGSGLGISGAITPVVDDSVFLKVSKHVVDPLFLFRPKKFTKAGQEAEKEIPIAYTWHGNTSYFNVEIHNPYSVELVIENIAIKLVPLIVSQVQRGKFDIRTDPDVRCEAHEDSGPVCRAIISAKTSTTLRVPVLIPRITNQPSSGQKSILLVPEHLNYTVFNCHFQERLFTRQLTSGPESEPITLAWAMPRSLRLLKNVPTMRALELRHTWNSNADAHNRPVKVRNAEDIAAELNALTAREGAMSPVPDMSTQVFPRLGYSISSSQSALSDTVVRLDGHLSPTADESQAALIQIQQLRCEEFRSIIKLTNEDSRFDIDEINVEVLENGISLQQAVADLVQQGSPPGNISSPQLETAFADMIQVIRKSLPIRPHQSIFVPINYLAEKFTSVIAVIFEYRSGGCEQDIFRRAQCVLSYAHQDEGLHVSNVEVLRNSRQEMDLEALSGIAESARALPHTAAGLTAQDSHLIGLDITNTSSIDFDVFTTSPYENSADRTARAFAPLRLTRTPPLCPICNKDTLLRRGQAGTFLCCIAYPDCRFYRENPESLDDVDYSPSKCSKCGSPNESRFSSAGLFWKCSRGSAECDAAPVQQSAIDAAEWKRLQEGPVVHVPAYSTIRMVVPIHPMILQREMIEEMKRSLVVPMSIVVGAPKLAKRQVPPINTLIRHALRWLLRFKWRCANSATNRYGYLSLDGSDLLSSPSLAEKLKAPPVRVLLRQLPSSQQETKPLGDSTLSDDGSLSPKASLSDHVETPKYYVVKCNELTTLRVDLEMLPSTLPPQIEFGTDQPHPGRRFSVSVVCNNVTYQRNPPSNKNWLPPMYSWVGKNLNVDIAAPIGLRDSLTLLGPDSKLPGANISVLIHQPGNYLFTASAIDMESHEAFWSFPIKIVATH